MLADSQVATRLPAKDLERARKFYSAKLGLEPVEQRPGGEVSCCRNVDPVFPVAPVTRIRS
jgi:catechol 2,3-dioxygenase-like lactoylglutathione lyase family enzyme